jgi:hypothetical protein
MRAMSGSGLVALVGLIAASACASDSPSAPSQPGTSTPFRLLTGTIFAGDSNQPIEGAVVSIVGGTDSTRTDGAGRFKIPAPAAALELPAGAAEFNTVRQPIELTQANVQLTLEPTILTFRWNGDFGSNGGRRVPEGMLDGFDFETRHTAEISLALSAACPTSGTYDDFDAWLEQGVRKVFGVSPGKAFTVDRRSMTLPPGAYRVNLKSGSFYAKPGCTWQLELARPY